MANSDIVNYLAGKSVFITGGTGFLGKVLVEKLLRCCPDIQRIYLLMRAKAGSDINARLEQLVDNKVHPRKSFLLSSCFHRILLKKRKSLGCICMSISANGRENGSVSIAFK